MQAPSGLDAGTGSLKLALLVVLASSLVVLSGLPTPGPPSLPAVAAPGKRTTETIPASSLGPGQQALAAARASLASTPNAPRGAGPPFASPTWSIHEFQRSSEQPLMVYDAADGYVLLFQGLEGNISNSTWEYSHGQWNELPTTTAPSPRSGAAMVYDAADREVVLFGGANNSYYASFGPFYNDTWIFKGGNWTPIVPLGSPAPPPRVFPSIAYDAAAGQVVLFGGTNLVWYTSGCQGQNFGDTWGFSGGVWSRLSGLTAAGPVARYGASLAFDPNLNSTVLFGGAIYQCSQNSTSLENDTWTFSSGNWTRLSTGTHSPSARVGANLAFDPISNTTDLFGGATGGLPFYLGAGASNDTWTLTSGHWVQSVAAGPPSGDAAGPLVYDPSEQGVILFGIPLWSLKNGTWSAFGPSPYPPQMAYPSLTYDAGDGYVLLVGFTDWSGGQGSSSVTWKYDQGTWTGLTTPQSLSPPWSDGSVTTYDPVDGYVVLFGGSANWTWSYHGGNWTDLHTRHSPPSEHGSRMTFDSRDGYVLLVGGSDCYPGYWYRDCQWHNETWKFSGGAWSQITPLNGLSPSPRSYATLAFDPSLDAVVLFGGMSAGPHASEFALNDTWIYSAGRWLPLRAADAPSPRASAVAAYSLVLAGLVLVGGDDVYAGGDYKPGVGGTWLLRNGSWIALGFPGQRVPGHIVDSSIVSVPSLGTEILYNPNAEVWILQSSGYSVRFTETGLPVGTSWDANLDGVWDSSSNSSITLAVGNGSHAFGIAPTLDFLPTPASGPVIIAGGSVNIFIIFGQRYVVTFQERGLPAETAWTVVFGTYTVTTPAPTAALNAPNGTYRFSVPPAGGLIAVPATGNATVDGSDLSLTIAFAVPTFNVIFTESNLPIDTPWGVVLDNRSGASTGPSIGFTEPNGTYEFSIVKVDGFTGPSSGKVTVQGSTPPVQIIFGQVLFSLTFQETGLPTDTVWGMSVGGRMQSTLASNLTFSVPTGSYEFVVLPIAGYLTNFSGSAIDIGRNITVSVSFHQETYPVTFLEFGLPSGASWTVSVSNFSTGFHESWSSMTSSFEVFLANGSYAVSFRLPLGLSGSLSSTQITVSGRASPGPTLTVGTAAASPLGTAASSLIIGAAAAWAIVIALAAALLIRRGRRPPAPPAIPSRGST